MEFVIFWLLFCIVPAVIAGNKGRSAAGWFFLSLVISPLLGGIIVACLRPMGAEVERRLVSGGEMKKCPYCAELVKREAKICRYCQREFAESPPEPPAPILGGIRVPSIPRVCPRCGAAGIRPIIEGRIYHCGPCGSDFDIVSA